MLNPTIRFQERLQKKEKIQFISLHPVRTDRLPKIVRAGVERRNGMHASEQTDSAPDVSKRTTGKVVQKWKQHAKLESGWGASNNVMLEFPCSPYASLRKAFPFDYSIPDAVKCQKLHQVRCAGTRIAQVTTRERAGFNEAFWGLFTASFFLFFRQ